MAATPACRMIKRRMAVKFRHATLRSLPRKPGTKEAAPAEAGLPDATTNATLLLRGLGGRRRGDRRGRRRRRAGWRDRPLDARLVRGRLRGVVTVAEPEQA